MLAGVLTEATPGETRVAATPATVAQPLKLGYEVVVEPGAGELASFSDEAYVEAGASVGNAVQADIVLVFVIGANDTANPAAAEDPGSSIAGSARAAAHARR